MFEKENNCLQRIQKLEAEINSYEKGISKRRNGGGGDNKSCSLINDVLLLNSCDLYIKNTSDKHKKSFNECIIKTNKIQDVINCVKDKKSQMNSLINAPTCELNSDCNYTLTSDDNWKIGCLVNAGSMAELIKCVNEFKSMGGDIDIDSNTGKDKDKDKDKHKKGKGKGKGNGKGKGKNNGKYKDNSHLESTSTSSPLFTHSSSASASSSSSPMLSSKKKGKSLTEYQKENKSKDHAIKKLQAKIKKLKKKKDGDTIIIPTSSGVESLNTSQVQGTTGYHDLTKPTI